MGMPKSGKTTQMDILGSDLQHVQGYGVRYIHEGARISPLDKKDYFMFNSWSFHNTLNRILEAQLTDYDFILVDRGVYDHEAFIEALYRIGRINQAQSLDSQRYFRQFRDMEDITFLHLIDAETSIRREYKYEKAKGRILNLEFLRILYEVYLDMKDEIKEKLILIDGSKPIEENQKEILASIQSKIKI